MATGGEDCATVLEQFIHDAANLPAEINYMMEEIQATDKDMQKHLTSIHSKDVNFQKHIKMNGSMQPHPKEQEYVEFTKKHYDMCVDLQKKKITHSEKACNLLDQQLRKLDVKIRELQSDGQLVDGPPLPSIFDRKPDGPKPLAEIAGANLPSTVAALREVSTNAHRGNASSIPLIRPPQPRHPSQQTITAVPSQQPTPPAQQRMTTPAAPAATLQYQKQPDREHSAGADSKRRKTHSTLPGVSIPSQPSSLRQSSLGPGTPKAGTPTAGSRAGSVPRTMAVPGTNVKKAGITKKVPHQQISKLKHKAGKHARLSMTGRKKGQSPSVRGGRGGTVASEEDSVLSSAEASDTDTSQSRIRRNKKTEDKDVEMEEADDDEGDEDDRRYCFCNQRSYGEMVACENDDCQYQWFHTGCLKMTKIPDEDEDWYCPECRTKPEILAKINKKQKKK